MQKYVPAWSAPQNAQAGTLHSAFTVQIYTTYSIHHPHVFCNTQKNVYAYCVNILKTVEKPRFFDKKGRESRESLTAPAPVRSFKAGACPSLKQDFL